ncbi:hypothetical protein [Treponema sp. OMZ 788]|uniref:hypothetical protein n=1 Tax=Treponema sp. OMZ 788 TaxID=2563664 RepID=UPI003531FA32
MPKKTAFLSKPEKSKSGQEFRHLRIIVSDSDKNNEQIVVSDTLLKRIQNALKQSKFVSAEVKSLFPYL